jgi:hypothetical protein
MCSSRLEERGGMGEGEKSNRLLFIYNVNFYVLTTHAGSNSLRVLPYDVIIILAPTQNNE